MSDGKEVANFILDYADNNGISITNLSLQKITYFCHVWYLITTNKPLIKQNFEAWEFGPVLPYLYRDFKNYGDQKITSRATKLDPRTGNRIVAKINLNSDEEEILRRIVSLYSRLTPSQLVDQSHAVDGPWHKVWNHETKVNPGMQINNESIVEFYTSKDRPYTLQ